MVSGLTSVKTPCHVDRKTGRELHNIEWQNYTTWAICSAYTHNLVCAE